MWKNLDKWPWEKRLDISKYKDFSNIILKRLDLAKEKWCDWVDPDNVDWYNNVTWFELTYEDQLEYNKFLSLEAHKRWLSIWLKNDLLQINDLVDYFDFAINESCYSNNECYYLNKFIENNKPVFGIEYKKNLKDFCYEAIKSKFSFVKDTYDLDWKNTKFCNEIYKK